jgi:D-ribose pyranose/furanose isomerase RbsD
MVNALRRINKIKEKNQIDKLTEEYLNMKRKYGVSLKDFEEKKLIVLEKMPITEKEYNKKLMEFKNIFKKINLRIAEMEMYPESSKEIKKDIRKGKETPTSRFELSLLSVNQYARKRRDQLLEYRRSLPHKYIRYADVLIENQISRFEIIKKEEEERDKIIDKMKLIPIESLPILDPTQYLNKEYLFLQRQYESHLEALKNIKTNF